ncbi:SRPBCC domain-containing protein [Ferruginibacter sp. HRS2-29]|uniref:SRPBCC family protein n=1 Tax=Ferruginibacter sp. HRS2-29 TaxID=2487334 RepID=UPI0020CE86D0|nr:SRPBCC domain-containing protein [Ferruginibacter sp. HRS2-29]MCP9750710.1 SRPBCC domain-containing protein [Ferruginibacter sp. HRS2-29]
MNNQLQFDFDVNKENNTIHVRREFNAPPQKVWAAWTKSELLDQWWAPKPWRAETKSMDFTVGGYWLYAMVGPKGEKQFCKVDFLTIEQQKSFSTTSAFVDENGVDQKTLPAAEWKNTFNNKGNGTLVDIMIKYDTLEDLETIIKMGFKEGFTMGLGNLDELLAL